MRLLQPLAVRSVALLWGGLSLSAVGDQLYAVALVWVAVGVFGPAAGYLSAAQAACGLLAALLVGRWADRWDQRRAMAGADAARAAILAGLVAWWLLRGAPPATGLVVAIVVLAIGDAVFRPAMTAVLPALLDRERLPAANALFDTTNRSARLIGPGLIGALAGSLPVVHFFTVDALSFLLSGAIVLRISAPAVRLAHWSGGSSVLAGIGLGFRALHRHRLLFSALCVSGVVNGLWLSGLYLALPLAIERAGITGPGGTGLGAYGLIVSAYGATNLLATLVVGSRPLPALPARMMFSGSVIVGVSIALLGGAIAAGLPLWLLMACSAAGAVGGPLGDIPVAVLRQTQLAPETVPAAMRAAMTVSYGSALLAMLAAPTAARLAGASTLLTLCGCGMAAASAVALVRHWNDGRHPA